MTDEEIIDYILSILKGSKKEAVQMRECIAKTAICQRLNASIEFMQKLNTRLARLNGFESGEVAWQGDMDATIKQNMELKEQIEKMENCWNCKFFKEKKYQACIDYKKNNIKCCAFYKWELAE